MLILKKAMIKFGTSGWRAIMGGEFTFQNVRIVVQAIANYLRKKFSGEKISVIMNYDTRFLSERFAFEAAKVLSHNQIHVFHEGIATTPNIDLVQINFRSILVASSHDTIQHGHKRHNGN